MNVVAFQRAAASIVAATATTLVVAAPTATSGRVTVTNAKGSATSDADFLIQTDAKRPTIVSFTPSVGTQGTQVTLTGSNFQLDANNDKLTSGGQFAAALSPTASGRQVVVFVAKEGQYQGRVLSAIAPDASQIAQRGL